MVEFFTRPYFDEVAKVLNNDAEFKSKTTNLDAKILMVAKDKGHAFLLTIQKGTAQVEDAASDAKADFTFVGDYDTWVSNHKGEAPLDKLVMTGKLKFKGSIPKIMSLRSQLVVIDKLAQSVDAEM